MEPEFGVLQLLDRVNTPFKQELTSTALIIERLYKNLLSQSTYSSTIHFYTFT